MRQSPSQRPGAQEPRSGDDAVTSPGTVSHLLSRMAAGEGAAVNELFGVVYPELRRIARGQLRRWNRRDGDETLSTTALVHETYLKLVGQDRLAWEHRAHFYAVAAKAMRQILVDHARREAAIKRGGDRRRISLEDVDRALASAGGPGSELAEALLALDRSLQRLERESERHSRIVECRFFGGMSIPDTAAALGISQATVKRGWALARSWLYRELKEHLD